MSIKNPYTLVAGEGLGISYSSHKQIGDLMPAEKLGQAKIQIAANVTTGNLFVQDHVVRVVENGAPLEFSFIYNSLANDPASAWRLAVAKRFTQLPKSGGSTATLVEVDGHITTYQVNPTTPNLYFAPGLENGTPYVYFDTTSQNWTWYHPGTKITEIYDQEGYLLSRTDAQGHVLNFKYSDTKLNGEKLLTAIENPANDNRYEFRYVQQEQGHSVSIYSICDQHEVPLQINQFDALGRLTTTQIQSPTKKYAVNYSYQDDSAYLTEISQTDNSALTFAYSLDPVKKVTGINIDANTTTIDSQQQNGATRVAVLDGSGSTTKLVLDDQGRLSSIEKEAGCLGQQGDVDVTTYNYSANGQIASVIRPDQGKEVWEYQNAYGLLTKHVRPNQQTTNYHYDTGDLVQSKNIATKEYKEVKESKSSNDIGRQPNLVAKARDLSSDQTLCTRYVYDNNYDGKNNRFLRFTVSPSGQVTEYVPNQAGYPDSKRVYLQNALDLSPYSPGQTPSLKKMIEWAGQQDQTKTNRSDYLHDSRGQKTHTYDYTALKTDGEGDKTDPAMGLDEYVWNEQGLWVEHNVKHDGEVTEKTSRTYDVLERISLHTDALGNATSYQYADEKSQVTVTQPNQRTELQQLNLQGLVTDKLDQVTVEEKAQSRKTNVDREPGGCPIVTTQPDGRQSISFFDEQRRPAYTITPTGIVTQFQYDKIHRFEAVTRYSLPVDINIFWEFRDLLPSLDLFINEALQADPKDRTSYKFFDASNRLQYTVDEDNYIVQFIYDSVDRVTGIVKYKNQISNDQLNALKNGLSLKLDFDANQDRYQQFVYNNDGKLIFEVDGAGYVTEYKRDIGGRVLEKVLYQNKIPVVLNQISKPIADDKRDAHTLYYYDARNQCVGEIVRVGVDPVKYYYTQHSYLACGLKEKTLRFANPISDPTWLANPTTDKLPVLPQSNSEDQTTDYAYDLLQRSTQVDAAFNRSQETQFDSMGHAVASQTFDRSLPNTTDPTFQRGQQWNYDGWEQVIAEANPFVAQRLKEIDADPSIPKDKKPIEKQKVWDNASLRHRYDESGLRLQSLDTQNNTTIFYYDQERRPVIVVNAIGGVTFNTYNTYNEIELVRKTVNKAPADFLKTLTGGFLTSDLQDKFNQLQSAQDSIVKKKFDKRGNNTQTIDEEGYITEKDFNAFRECAQERLPLNELTPSIKITHQYDPRGLETLTTNESKDITTQVSREYDNPYGKETLRTDERRKNFKTDYDQRGNKVYTLDEEKGECFTSYDAFNRVDKEVDAELNVVAHTYKQSDHSHTVTYAEGNVAVTTANNVFEEIISRTDALQQRDEWHYLPNGQVGEHVDPLGNSSKDEYDWEDRHTAHVDENNTKTGFYYDAIGGLNQKITDEGGLELTMSYQAQDALRLKTKVLDPKGNQSIETRDRRGLLMQTLTDPAPSVALHPENQQILESKSSKPVSKDDPLSLTTNLAYNGLGKQVSEQKGDVKEANQYQKTSQTDSLNRATGNTIDPTGLAITTQQKLDAAGLAIVKIDANKKALRCFYDGRRRLRFQIDPLGGVKESVYDKNDNVICERQYDGSIDVTKLADNTQLEFVIGLVQEIKNSALDTAVWFFYDHNKREKFRVSGQGEVSETVYDAASRKIQTKAYSSPITVDPNTISTDELAKKIVVDLQNDRTTYRIFDAKNQERFNLDATGVICEHRYNNLGQVIAKIKYANRTQVPAGLAKLAEDKVLAELKQQNIPDAAQDRAEFSIYDNAGRLLFKVIPAGNVDSQLNPYDLDNRYAVVGFVYDKNNNLVQRCQYTQTIQAPDKYSDLVAQLSTWTADATKDRVFTYEYDAANRCKSTTDPLFNKETFVPDALGDVKTIFDRKDFCWTKAFDRAARITDRLTPVVGITSLDWDERDPGKVSKVNNESKEIITHFDYDANGRVIKRTTAYNRPEAIATEVLYNSCNQFIGTKQYSVNSPDKLVRTTKVVRNAKQLKIAKQNKAGEWVYFVRDLNDRIIFKINALGQTIAYTRNSYGQVSAKRYYNNFLDVSALRLQTKYIDQNKSIPSSIIQEALQQIASVDDRIQTWKYDQRGDAKQITDSNPTQKNDAFSSIVNKTYNAFHQWTYQSEIMSNVALETKGETKANSNGRLSEQFRWLSRTGKVLAECDAQRKVTRNDYNPHGEQVQHSEWSIAPNIQITPATTLTELMNAHVVSLADINIQYQRDLRGKITKEIQKDVVMQVVAIDPITQRPVLQDKKQDVVKEYQYDQREQQTTLTTSKGSKYFYWDAAKRKVAQTDVIRGVQDEKGAVTNLIPIKTLALSSHGSVLLEQMYKQGVSDAKPSVLPVVTPDADDRITANQVDLLNRTIAATKDPLMEDRLDGIEVTRQARKDLANRVIAKVDPNGNVTRIFCDQAGHKCLEIDPEGGVFRWIYDGMHRIKSTRHYNTSIDISKLSDASTLSDALSLLVEDSKDTVAWMIYDSSNRECFRINGVGAVQQKCYNLAGHEVALIQYDKIFDGKVTEATLVSMLSWVDSAKNKDKDPVTNYIVDEAGRKRFVIDPEGAVIEQLFDTFGRVIQRISYYNPVADVSQIINLPPDQVRAKLTLDSKRDSTNYFVFNAQNKIIYQVLGEGNVIRFGYDEESNQIGECECAQKIFAKDYNDLLQQVAQLQANPNKDRLSLSYFNNASQVIKKLDPLQNSDSYGFDIFGNPLSHTDRNNNLWKLGYDRADRKINEETPTITVTPVTFKAGDPSQLDAGSEIKTTVKTTLRLDKNGNHKGIDIAATQTGSKARTFNATVNGRNQVVATETPNVAIDDPGKAASFSQRPENLTSVVTQQKFNAKGHCVAQQGKNGGMTFFVRDMENRIIYKVNPRGAVTQYVRDTFGNVAKEIKFATGLGIDLKPYFTNTGLSEGIILQYLKPDSKNDRTTTFTRNRNGDETLKESDKVFCLVPNGDKPFFKKDLSPKIKTDYDALRNPIRTAKLRMSTTGQEVWAETLQWFDRNNLLSAKISPNLIATRYARNEFDQEQKRTELATKLDQRIDPSQLVEAVDQAMSAKVSTKDRIFNKEHDQCGRKKKETTTGVLNTSVQRDDKNNVKLNDQTNTPETKDQVVTLSRSFEYGPTSTEDKPTAVTFENGGKKGFHYNPLGWCDSETGVPRQDGDKTLVPLTHYGLNEFGQTVLTTKFANGTAVPEEKTSCQTRPVPKSKDDAHDQTTLKLLDSNGVLAEQDGENKMTAYTNTASGKVARTFYQLTNAAGVSLPEANANPVSENKGEQKATKPKIRTKDTSLKDIMANTVTHLDVKKTDYDLCDNPVRKTFLRDNPPVPLADDVTETDFDMFDSPIAEGPEGQRPVYWKRDQLGRVWSTNAKDGVEKILAYNLDGEQNQETALWQAPGVNDHLAEKSYDDLPELVSWDITRLEKTETTRDLENKVTAQTLPAYYATADVLPDDVPININIANIISKDNSRTPLTQLSWPLNEIRNVSNNNMGFTIWPIANPDAKRKLPVSIVDNRYVVDASDLATDIYEYQLDYTFNLPTIAQKDQKNDPMPSYRSKGQIQFTTQNTTESLTIVPVVQPDGKVLLAGKIQNINQVKVIAVNKTIPAIVKPVLRDEKTGNSYVDLSDQVSGSYSLEPMTETGNSKLQATLPFTLYTEHTDEEVVAREIPCETSLKCLENWGQLIWKVPDALANQDVKAIITYQGDEQLSYTQEFKVNVDSDEGEHKDDQGNVLHANIKFEHNVTAIKNITLYIKAPDNEWVLLRKEETPINDPTGLRVLPEQDPNSRVFRLLNKNQKKVENKVEDKKPERQETKAETPALVFDDDACEIVAGTIKTTNFINRHAIYLSSIVADKPPNLTYLDTSLNQFATTKGLQSVDVTKNGTVLDVTGMKTGIYPFQCGTNGVESNFTISNGGNVFPPIKPDKPIKLKKNFGQGSENATKENKETKTNLELKPTVAESKSQTEKPKDATVIRPTRQYTFDRWENLTKYIAADGAVTDNTFNLLDETTTVTLPGCTVVDEHGKAENVRSVTTSTYNELGNRLTLTDDNQNTETWDYNAAGFETAHRYADGLVDRISSRNCLDQTYQFIDGRNRTWGQEFYKNNLLKSCSNGYRSKIYGYTELGDRTFDIVQVPGVGQIGTSYVYDVRRNCTATISPDGATRTNRTFDRNGQTMTHAYSTGENMSWERDYFGRLKTHTDLGGAQYTYTLNNKGEVIKQTGNTYRTYAMLQPSTYMQTYWDKAHQSQVIVPIEIYTSKFGSAPQNLDFNYTAGRLVKVVDNSLRQVTNYSHDVEGRRVGAEIRDVDTNTILQKTKAQLNALGENVCVFDTYMTFVKGRDRVGNTRVQEAWVGTPDAPIDIKKSWSKFDKANRVTVTGGNLVNGQITGGTSFGYTNGLRTSENSPIASINIGYEPNTDQLQTTQGTINSGRDYDPLQAYVRQYSETSGGVGKSRGMACDINNRVSTVTQFDGTDKTETVNRTFFPNGSPQTQAIEYNQDDPDKWVSDSYTIESEKFDSFRAKNISGYRTEHKTGNTAKRSASAVVSDPNNNISCVIGAADGGGDSPTQNLLLTTTFGTPLEKQYTKIFPSLLSFFSIESRERFFYDQNGNPLASWTKVIESITPRIFAEMGMGGWGQPGVGAGTTMFSNIQLDDPITLAGRSAFPPHSQTQTHIPKDVQIKGDPNLLYSNPFAILEDAMRPALNNIPFVPENYEIATGDTLESIAQSQYGDTAYAKAIADANNLNMGDVLTPGAQLKMPLLMPSHLTGNTHTPNAELLQEIIGNIYPYLTTPQPTPPKRHHHHSFWQKLLSVVEEVVAVALPSIIFPGIGTIGAAFMAAAIDAGEQLIGSALGVQKFSFTDVMETGLTAGLNTYFKTGSSIFSSMKNSTIGTLSPLQQVTTFAKVAITQQAIEMGLGIRKHFDLQGLLLSIATQTVNTQINAKLPNGIARTAADTVADAAITGAVTGHVDLQSVAAQFLGTEIGTAIATTAGSAIKKMMPCQDEVKSENEQKKSKPQRSTKETANTESKAAAPKSKSSGFTAEEKAELDKTLADAKAITDKPITIDPNDPKNWKRFQQMALDGNTQTSSAPKSKADRWNAELNDNPIKSWTERYADNLRAKLTDGNTYLGASQEAAMSANEKTAEMLAKKAAKEANNLEGELRDSRLKDANRFKFTAKASKVGGWVTKGYNFAKEAIPNVERSYKEEGLGGAVLTGLEEGAGFLLGGAAAAGVAALVVTSLPADAVVAAGGLAVVGIEAAADLTIGTATTAAYKATVDRRPPAP